MVKLQSAVCLWLVTSSVTYAEFGEPFIGTGAVSGVLVVGAEGGNSGATTIQGTMDHSVSFDPSNPAEVKSRHDAITVHFEPVAFSFTNTVIRPGTLEQLDITTTISVEAATWTLSQPIEWRINTDGGLLTEASPVSSPFPLQDQFSFIGTWEVSGPTETQSGQLTQTFHEQLVDGFAYDPAGIPTSVTRLVDNAKGVTFQGIRQGIDLGTVDGVGWSFAFTKLQMSPTGDVMMNVPEPSTCVIVGIGACSLLGYGWKGRRVKNRRSAT